MTDQINDEGGAKPSSIPSFDSRPWTSKRFARMLAIKRRHQLAGKEVRE